MKVDIQRAYECDLYLQHLLEFKHFQNYKSELTNLDSDAEYHLVKHYNDTLSPKLNDNLNCLSNENSCGSLTYY